MGNDIEDSFLDEAISVFVIHENRPFIAVEGRYVQEYLRLE